MPYFVVTAIDRPDCLPLRMATREAHFAFARANTDKIRFGGPFLDGAGDMAGSLMIVEVADRAAAEALSEADPYRRAGLFETVDIRPWKHTFGALP
ncbi:MAG TPA: YciI family protein [Caulobacteraceae bacterium]|nr:YciI family protein [Caulobacteraceae bacterium]